MWKTILRRFIIMIPQLFILSIIVFILAKLMPGDHLQDLSLRKLIHPHWKLCEEKLDFLTLGTFSI